MYLNLIQIAESFGVSEHNVLDWVRREGMPHVHDRGRILFEQAPVMEWAAQRGLAAHTGFLAEQSAQSAQLALLPLLRRGGIWRDVAASSVNLIFENIVLKLPGLSLPVQRLLIQRLCAPGGVTMAPVGNGFALPHPSMRVSLGEHCALVALIMLNEALAETQTPDGRPITRMLFFISPTPRQHVNMLGLLARSISSGALLQINAAMSDHEIYQAMDKVSASAQGINR